MEVGHGECAFIMQGDWRLVLKSVLTKYKTFKIYQCGGSWSPFNCDSRLEKHPMTNYGSRQEKHPVTSDRAIWILTINANNMVVSIHLK